MEGRRGGGFRIWARENCMAACLLLPEYWRGCQSLEVKKSSVLVVPAEKAQVCHSILELYLFISQFLQISFVSTAS